MMIHPQELTFKQKISCENRKISGTRKSHSYSLRILNLLTKSAITRHELLQAHELLREENIRQCWIRLLSQSIAKYGFFFPENSKWLTYLANPVYWIDQDKEVMLLRMSLGSINVRIKYTFSGDSQAFLQQRYPAPPKEFGLV